jgi:hypothetical protein
MKAVQSLYRHCQHNGRAKIIRSPRFLAASVLSADNPWDEFYLRHSKQNAKAKVGAFRDRHYLRASFRDLMPSLNSGFDPAFHVSKIDPSAPHCVDNEERLIHMLEMGCGVGNALFPLLRATPNITAEACDVSPSAF